MPILATETKIDGYSYGDRSRKNGVSESIAGRNAAEIEKDKVAERREAEVKVIEQIEKQKQEETATGQGLLKRHLYLSTADSLSSCQ